MARNLKNSIVAGHLARMLSEKFKPDGKMHSEVMQGGKFDLWVHARACTINRKPSGGIVIWASANPAPKSVSAYRFELTKRIRKPVDLKRAIYRHAADLVERVRQDRANLIWELRDSVEAEADLREFDPDSLPPDHGTEYETMTEQDCRFWLDWLKSKPMKGENHAAQ